MPFVNAKCTNCGANLEVDNAKDAAICPYCNTAYIIEKAIKNYNTTNNITNNITANAVNIYSSDSADFVIRAGELVKYNGASDKVYIPNTVKIIGHEAFVDCIGMTEIVIPNSVVSIGSSAFLRCSGLTKVVIPNSVVSIDGCAFWHCVSLKEIVIPNSVVGIGGGAFWGCISLVEIVIPDSVTAMGESVFRECTALQKVVLSKNITEIQGGTFKKCKSLQTFYIPHNIKKICTDYDDDREYNAGGAFEDSGLKEITISNDETIIERWALGDKIERINASDSWKRKNYNIDLSVRKCLGAYAPKESGCYVATSVYGSYNCPEVWVLRRYRDCFLAQTRCGRLFIKLYYFISPKVLCLVGNDVWFQNLCKKRLDHFVKRLQDKGYENTPYNDMI